MKKLIKADELYSEYDEQLKLARVNAQAIIGQSEKETTASDPPFQNGFLRA